MGLGVRIVLLPRGLRFVNKQMDFTWGVHVLFLAQRGKSAESSSIKDSTGPPQHTIDISDMIIHDVHLVDACSSVYVNFLGNFTYRNTKMFKWASNEIWRQQINYTQESRHPKEWCNTSTYIFWRVSKSPRFMYCVWDLSACHNWKKSDTVAAYKYRVQILSFRIRTILCCYFVWLITSDSPSSCRQVTTGSGNSILSEGLWKSSIIMLRSQQERNDIWPQSIPCQVTKSSLPIVYKPSDENSQACTLCFQVNPGCSLKLVCRQRNLRLGPCYPVSITQSTCWHLYPDNWN